jgi:transmembrane sensor
LLEGKVRVVCGIEGEKYILHPGQQVSYLKNTGASYLTDANVEDVTAWQRGILVFRSVTVKDMMITLQRKYNITIQYNEARFNNDKYNFRFSEKATIQEVFAVMKEVIGGFEYTVENDVYTVQ